MGSLPNTRKLINCSCLNEVGVICDIYIVALKICKSKTPESIQCTVSLSSLMKILKRQKIKLI